jgi:hypothetical protein
MYFALGNKEKKEKIFVKEEVLKEALKIIVNNYPNWSVFTNFELCDILLIKNFNVNVEEGLNTNSQQPFFKTKPQLVQKIIAINFLDKNDVLPEETISKLNLITCAHIITSHPQKIRGVIDELSGLS